MSGTAPRRRKVLVLEEQAVAAMELCESLSERGYQVVGPFARPELIREASMTAVDAAILSYPLRQNSAVEIAHRLRGLRRPVVFTSAYSDRGAFQEVESTGAAAYVLKPVHSELLVCVLDLLLLAQPLSEPELEVLAGASADRPEGVFLNPCWWLCIDVQSRLVRSSAQRLQRVAAQLLPLDRKCAEVRGGLTSPRR